MLKKILKVKLVVIAKSEWFKREDGGFFGSKNPWQGNIFLICTVLVLLIGILSFNVYFGWLCSGIFLFLFCDAMYAGFKTMDERDKQHYSIAMRNTAWAMLLTMIILSTLSTEIVFLKNINWLIMITAGIGGITNILTRYKLNRDS
jgi:hypothetical protein